MSGPQLLISAGEPSGDRHAARFLEAFRRAHPGVKAFGLGGPELRDQGLECLARMEDLAVVGLVEVIGKLPAAMGALGRLVLEARRRRPDLVVPVDFPDFNLRLASRAHRLGLKVLYYVSPQVWAWREGRVEGIRRDVDRMGVVFPFEAEFYRERGFKADFVGHPLLEEMHPPTAGRAEVRTRLGLAGGGPLVALFPGSRAGEVRRHWPLLLDAARALAKERADVRFAAAFAPGLPAGCLPVPTDLRLAVLAGAEHDLFHCADAAAVAAGTATLEALLAGCPTVAFYKTSGLTYALLRRAARVTRVSLANLASGEDLVRELLQGAATPAALAGELRRLLDDAGAREAMGAAAVRLRARLGGLRASQEMTRIAGELLWTNS